MKTIAGILYGVLAGVFLAVGVIVFTQMIGAGADSLGFTVWTYRYYVLCLGICVALLTSSSACREHWIFMGFFGVAVVMVMAVGFQSVAGVSVEGGQAGQMQTMVTEIISMLVKLVMYVAPGGLTAFYAYTAFDSLPRNYSRPERS
ncbi:hypothetical protein [Pseudomonas amygdali]|uniref:hypothetical protein n=1 Tax=Pseudomonas amygdali TaxID=47877 RepID=UPI0006E65457|nr:hypothetical protein [Pseudomonas amygdali]KPY55667.1 hypothetical protein ALO93_200102 [Pseudomonas amygdali pv. sesami]